MLAMACYSRKSDFADVCDGEESKIWIELDERKLL